ncbi:magnesium chelatase [candidate division KSB1 bacterium RBG_16_48_16]|nr:MAG: magnesium chelatase [candidate division KSB1 bacterium RBG_16_48_16]
MVRNELLKIKTFGQLKASGYKSRPIKDELRENLICRLKAGSRLFDGILGYDDSVVPDLERAILSRHNIILLGLRGQAKTKIARLMIDFLDELIPVVAGSEINDDPFQPVSKFARDLVSEAGDDTPIEWLHRNERYTEKLATPDVSIADIIGDVDPIKAATLKLPYSDERVIHYGLIPHSHRSIFVINELPDLQARIQVALFNILQERDIQIRGFKIRLPLDIQFVFTANPEDYTNRGSIVTPLKDRIESQILTHYPKTMDVAKAITRQEIRTDKSIFETVRIPELAQSLIEQIAFEARKSEYIDAKSGVSARLPITAYESLASAAERRLYIHEEEKTVARISDFDGIIPAITGKVELVYEGEQEGPAKVARYLIGKSIRSVFVEYFPNPEKFKKTPEKSPYYSIAEWFRKGNALDILNDISNDEYEKTLYLVPNLAALVETYVPKLSKEEKLSFMEFALHGLAEYSILSKQVIESGLHFEDLLSSMLSSDEDDDVDDLPRSDYHRQA